MTCHHETMLVTKIACKKFNCCGEAFVCALCITGFGKSNDDDDDCALMEYREKHLKLQTPKTIKDSWRQNGETKSQTTYGAFDNCNIAMI